MPAQKTSPDSVRNLSNDLLQLGLRYTDAAEFLKVAWGGSPRPWEWKK